MIGAGVVGGLTYLQYQATQAGNYAVDLFRHAKDFTTGAAGSLFGNAKGIADQTRSGWERTKENLAVPTWMQEFLHRDGKGEESGGPGPEPPRQSKAGGAAALGTGAAFGYAQSPEDDERTGEQAARDDQMMMLTKKMIEIRSILQMVGQSNALVLPSIVVIGSQSSGKSSVLEAIVGHEFLPKGSNMITRRPIELTLVNTPEAKAEYGEFPALGLGKVTDFASIQKTLTDLNLAVPAEQCVSDDPIQLTISSPNVPDLSLIDLPGYIQVAGADQPVELKQKIADLCDKYIQPPNVILAISAADVDLANSTALRASRRVDPRGERTIGVVTKMDLVDPHRGASILDDRKYPLRLGYVGVVSKVPQQSSLFSRGSGNITNAITKNENAYFSSHPLEFGPESHLAVGTTTLRKKLMHVLEQTMAASLQGTSDAIHQELEEATYEFKRRILPRRKPGRLQALLQGIRRILRPPPGARAPQGRARPARAGLAGPTLLEQTHHGPLPPLPEVDPLSSLPKSDPDSLYWHRKLDASTSSLTKLGIGRLATTVVANALQSEIDRLIEASTFANHPFARQAITDASQGILNERFYSTSDQVENCIKPYKFEIEVDPAEWARGRSSATLALQKELKACDGAMKTVETSVGGRRKLRDVMAFIDRVRNGDVILEGDSASAGAGGAGGFSASLLARGREALFLRDRASILAMRLAATKSPQCAKPENRKYHCPEIFLDVVADKLTATAVLFLNVELLSEFYYNFPRELDLRLGRHLSPEEVERFAREDKRVRGHLDVIRRKEMLELVLRKMEGLKGLEGREGGRMAERAKMGGEERRGAGGGGKERGRGGGNCFDSGVGLPV
ncbi:MAG: mitochondrial dynamin GTPase Msp1 [Ramalina farinacea]|uniref:dynamin GTPase n=1 Tax=Ramalina farinacea TaxID=258253 RepID=A0AA43QJW9_9LECA|nr:mitochondrial dynamin GTPase Msp1 [Ramalina farinacea]